jgi:hypothetical protein
MTARIIYTAMASELPPWAYKAIEEVKKGFVWRGGKEGGGSLPPSVARPKELGGLGIFDVRRLSWPLRAIWLWLQRTDPNKPWAQFQIQTCKEVQFLVDMSVVTEIGDGSNTLFWKDRWLHGRKIRDIAPQISAMVSKRIVNKRKVNEALQNLNWTADFQGALSVTVLLEFVELFQQLEGVAIRPGVSDSHIWRLSTSGQYSSKSAYAALFQGAVQFEPAERIWRSWPPGKCKFFSWLVQHNTGAGPRIGWRSTVWTTRIAAHFVNRKTKISIT